MTVSYNSLPSLEAIHDVIQDNLERIKEAEQVILRWRKKAYDHSPIKTGDIVEFAKTKDRYVVLEKLPDVVIKDISFRNDNDPIEYDIKYVGLRMRPTGKPFYDSRTGMNHRVDLYHSHLERGIMSIVGFYPDIEKRDGKYAHL